MNLPAALARMQAAGTVLEVQDGELVVHAQHPLNEIQRTFLRQHKAALVELLTVTSHRWYVLTDQWESHIVYPEPVTLETVQADYPGAEKVRPA